MHAKWIKLDLRYRLACSYFTGSFIYPASFSQVIYVSSVCQVWMSNPSGYFTRKNLIAVLINHFFINY